MKRLRWYDFIFINLFWIGLNIRNNAVGTVFQPYLVGKYAAGDWVNTALSIMNNAGLIIAMLVQPAIGLISDRSTSRFGRRRPFIIFGALLDLVFLVAIALSWSYWSLFAAIMLIQFSANISHGALQGLIPDMVPEDQRGRASAVKSIFELLPISDCGLYNCTYGGSRKTEFVNRHNRRRIAARGIGDHLFSKRATAQREASNSFLATDDQSAWHVGWYCIGCSGRIGWRSLIGGVAGLISWLIAGKEAVIPILVGVGGIIAMILAIVIGVWAGARTTIGKEASQHRSFIWWIVNRLLFLAAITSLRSFALYFFEYSFKITAEQATGFVGNLTLTVGIFQCLGNTFGVVG